MGGKYIVTGGAGFIGSNLIEALNRRGEEHILVVDDLGQDEKWRNLVGLNYADYWDKDDFRFHLRNDSLGEADIVFHLGACSSTTERNASFLADNNYRFTCELCEWCLRHKARFIYASSAATYGDGSEGYRDDFEKIGRLKPLNMYGYSKQMFDLWALRHGLFDKIAGVKYFNIYGPREAHKGDMRSMVHKAFCQIRETGTVRLFKSENPDYRAGEQLRDFMFVRDAVEATIFLAENGDANGLFNCGTAQARTWLDLARAVFAALKREPQIEFIDMPETLRAKYQYHTEADVSRLRAAGYSEPFAPLEEGVREYIAWLQSGKP
ncbi:MAG: ADP-glyceromanno-heptose 6-epimerase [Kiritimatiellae bacterium]|jgi:ADP-L-glycero-D-manno-heptose 6-epimerase|nr:ADP-glyceromanno-heptose 6-epimerase [Kiritimatiellia bacterium]